MAETCRYPKRHQGRSKEGRKRIPMRRGSMCSLKSRLNHLRTLDKAQQELEYNKE